MVKIDLDDVYNVQYFNDDFTKFSFISPTINGESVLISVEIKLAEEAFLNEFLNLSFGPVVNGQIDDAAKKSA